MPIAVTEPGQEAIQFSVNLRSKHLLVAEEGKSYYSLTKVTDAQGKCFADKGNVLTLLRISGELALVTNGTDKFSVFKHLLSPCPAQLLQIPRT